MTQQEISRLLDIGRKTERLMTNKYHTKHPLSPMIIDKNPLK